MPKLGSLPVCGVWVLVVGWREDFWGSTGCWELMHWCSWESSYTGLCAGL
jgi:hypothetical protein